MKNLLLLGLVCVVAGCNKMDTAESEEYVHEGRTLKNLLNDVRDSDESVRLDAYESLKTIGPEDKEAVPALIKALKDEDPKVR